MASPHILVFPFMAKGHTFPMLQLARLLLRHGAAVTLITTPWNRPLISSCLSDTTISVIDIPFPQNLQSIPPDVESTDKLPDISLWPDLLAATKLMQPHFEQHPQACLLYHWHFPVVSGTLARTRRRAALFGTQVEILQAQFREIQIGLEKSGVNFLWLVRKNELDEGFEERVKSRGTLVKEWVDQREILEHETVRGFLCHCGWNSVMESLCAKVPILAWPMMWEQPVNARMVVDGAGGGGEGSAGEEVRKKAEEVGGAAVKAVEEGGSSWEALDQLINELNSF
ncbi:UDP-glycosyltransferase 90A2-like [Sesamum indicum]|uniref:UDP-glycosyltransferase 90A2-like n=1 Tax=Sesamum indicum TaxID=4182 RepID=A0A8M8UW59_SESIN|nr:UDP-glycosyltransferase 90A2-like [Sesamum indicum]